MEPLTVAQVARQLRVSEQTVRIWLRTGKLNGYRLGGARIGWRVPVAEVERVQHGERVTAAA